MWLSKEQKAERPWDLQLGDFCKNQEDTLFIVWTKLGGHQKNTRQKFHGSSEIVILRIRWIYLLSRLSLVVIRGTNGRRSTGSVDRWLFQ